jgi:hypothetical protein
MRLHWLSSQLSVTFTDYHTLSRTQSLHFTLRADCDIFFVKLSPRSDSAANSPKRLVSKTATQQLTRRTPLQLTSKDCLDISVPLINPRSYERHCCLLPGHCLPALPWKRACCRVAALGAVLLGTARHGTEQTPLPPPPRSAYFGREAFSCRLPSNALLRNPTKGWHVTVFISPNDRLAQLYPQVSGSLSVASDSQGYDGGILNRLHTG